MTRHSTAFTRVTSLQVDHPCAQAIHRALMRLYMHTADEAWAEQASCLRERLYPASWLSRMAAMSSPLRFL